jgi:hypothetical protein
MMSNISCWHCRWKMCLQELQTDKLSYWTPSQEGPSLRGGSGISLLLVQGCWMRSSHGGSSSLSIHWGSIQSSSLLSLWSPMCTSLKTNSVDVNSSGTVTSKPPRPCLHHSILSIFSGHLQFTNLVYITIMHALLLLMSFKLQTETSQLINVIRKYVEFLVMNCVV